jgi:hypothetical protein
MISYFLLFCNNIYFKNSVWNTDHWKFTDYFQRHLQTIWEKNYSYKNHNCSFCNRVFLKNTISNRFGSDDKIFSFAFLRNTYLQSRSKEIQQGVSYNRASQFRTEKAFFFCFLVLLLSTHLKYLLLFLMF